MWLFTINEYTVFSLVLAVGLAAILLIRRFPGYKPTGKKAPRAKRGSDHLGPVHHHRDDPHVNDHHV